MSLLGVILIVLGAASYVHGFRVVLRDFLKHERVRRPAMEWSDFWGCVIVALIGAIFGPVIIIWSAFLALSNKRGWTPLRVGDALAGESREQKLAEREARIEQLENALLSDEPGPRVDERIARIEREREINP